MNNRSIAIDLLALLALSGGAVTVSAQSVGSLTQTVSQRNTQGMLIATPSAGIAAGQTVVFTYVLSTAGAPAPTSETVQFMDGSSALGTPQTISLVPAANLLPYSQVNVSDGWTTVGSLPTVTPLVVSGPDGSSNSATNLSFADSTSGVIYAVPSSTSYANQQVTFSIWVKSASTATLILTVMDNPHVGASQTSTCSANSTWQRCSLTYTFPSGSGSGFSVSLSASTYSQVISVWGAQFEQAAQPGPYVSTIGTARPSGGQAGTATLNWSQFGVASHTITVQYAGDANFIGSTSNAVSLSVTKQLPGIALTALPLATSVYGASVTLTAQLTDPNLVQTPSGTVQFFDGASLLGTSTLDGTGKGALTLVGSSSLGAGSHSITAHYGGDSNFAAIVSSVLSHIVTKANSSSVVNTTVSSSLNPSIYGDEVSLLVHVTSSVGVQPTGSVVITDGSTTLGSPVLDGSGNATLTIPLFTAGTHTLVITYSGDSNYD